MDWPMFFHLTAWHFIILIPHTSFHFLPFIIIALRFQSIAEPPLQSMNYHWTTSTLSTIPKTKSIISNEERSGGGLTIIFIVLLGMSWEVKFRAD